LAENNQLRNMIFNKNEDKNHQNKIKKMLERGKIDTPNTTAHFILLVHALQ
jgi:hypothetical protein